MSHRAIGTALIVGALLGAAPFLSEAVPFGQETGSTTQSSPQDDTKREVAYRVVGKSPLRNRKLTGDVLTEVQGVPASPIDSFCYDGIGSDPIKGRIVLDVDPLGNTGYVKAVWHDEHGKWELWMDFFAHPHHPSGLRVAPDATEEDLVILDPVVTNVYLHGNTTAGQPVLPTVFCFMAVWGPATVTLNGEHFKNEIDGAFRPQWDAHLMVTSGVRDDDGTVRSVAGEIYHPVMHAANGLVEHEDLEFHLVFHDERYPLNHDNFPPLFDFFYHLLFEDVNIRIKHKHVEGDQ